jgi:hypothetical protein
MKTGLHTNAQCKTKLKGVIKVLSMIETKGLNEWEVNQLVESANEMCKELIRELEFEEDTN